MLRVLWCWLLGLVGCVRPGAPVEPPRPAALVELVQTVPVETSVLQVPLPATHEVWLEMVRGARERIDLAQFYVVDQAPSRLSPVLDAVAAASARGVQVRLLADAKFHRTYPEWLDGMAQRPGVELRLFEGEALGGGVHHAKVLIVDGQDLYVGSANFDWRALEHIHELGVRVREPGLVGAFNALFALDWARAGGEAPPPRPALAPFPVVLPEQGLRVTPVWSPAEPSPDPALWDMPRLVQLIEGAQARVRVQLLSLDPVDAYTGQPLGELDEALRRAAARGVRVEVLLADWSRKPGVIEELHALAQAGLDIRLVTVPEHSGGPIPYARVIHAKTLVVDGERAWVGTSNWAWGYFHQGRNAGLVLEGASVAGPLEAIFEQLWASGWAAPL